MYVFLQDGDDKEMNLHRRYERYENKFQNKKFICIKKPLCADQFFGQKNCK